MKHGSKSQSVRHEKNAHPNGKGENKYDYEDLAASCHYVVLC